MPEHPAGLLATARNFNKGRPGETLAVRDGAQPKTAFGGQLHCKVRTIRQPVKKRKVATKNKTYGGGGGEERDG